MRTGDGKAWGGGTSRYPLWIQWRRLVKLTMEKRISMDKNGRAYTTWNCKDRIRRQQGAWKIKEGEGYSLWAYVIEPR